MITTKRCTNGRVGMERGPPTWRTAGMARPQPRGSPSNAAAQPNLLRVQQSWLNVSTPKIANSMPTAAAAPQRKVVVEPRPPPLPAAYPPCTVDLQRPPRQAPCKLCVWKSRGCLYDAKTQYETQGAGPQHRSSGLTDQVHRSMHSLHQSASGFSTGACPPAATACDACS